MSDTEITLILQVGAICAYLVYWHTRLRIVLKTIDALHRCSQYVTQAIYIECMAGAMAGQPDISGAWSEAAGFMQTIMRHTPRGDDGLWRSYRDYKEAKLLLQVINETYDMVEL